MSETNQLKNREFLEMVYGDMAEAERMFKADPQVLDCRTISGETAFHYLIVESDIERAKVLLAWGADINTQDNFGATPLMSAVTLGDLEVVRWLTQHGSSLELKNVNDETALASATSNEKGEYFPVPHFPTAKTSNRFLLRRPHGTRNIRRQGTCYEKFLNHLGTDENVRLIRVNTPSDTSTTCGKARLGRDLQLPSVRFRQCSA